LAILPKKSFGVSQLPRVSRDLIVHSTGYGALPVQSGPVTIRQRHPAAEEVIRETLDLLAYWLGSIIDLLEPEVIVGGRCFDDARALFE